MIIQWSLGAEAQSTLIEKETAPWCRRLESARLCQDAGYIVRFRLSPIIPVKNWREENEELIAKIFELTSPDVIPLCAFGWMGFSSVKACLDLELLDPEFLSVMEASAPFIEQRGFYCGGVTPLPHEARAVIFKFLIDQVRRHNRNIPIALCLETVETWELFKEELGMSPPNYYYNCGPMCTPEHPLSKGVRPGHS